MACKYNDVTNYMRTWSFCRRGAAAGNKNSSSTAQLRSLSRSVRARTATGQQRNNFMPNQPANLVAPRGEEGAEASGFGLAGVVVNTNAFVVLLILFSHHACKHVNSCPLFIFYTIKLIKTVCLSWDWGWEYLL